jgi:UDP-glucuronate decarboxylase
MHPNDGRVISNFIVQALRGGTLNIYGEGSQTRSFCYVDDMVEGLVLLMKTANDVTGPINLGNPDEYSILELAQRILEITGSKSKLVFSPLPQDDPQRRRPDITLARDILKWNPKVSLEVGLPKVVDYFDNLLRSGIACK